MRTIGFVGGEFVPGSSGNVCRYFRGAYYGILDDCNEVKAWAKAPGNATDAQPGSGVAAYNGTLLSTGGGNGSAMQYQVLFNSDAPDNNGHPGLIRTGGADLSEMRPATPDNSLAGLFKGSTPPYVLPLVVPNSPLVVNSGFVYAVGGEIGGNSSPCQRIYRARLATATWWVDAGSWLSPPCDLGVLAKMTKVAWSYSKSGGAAPTEPGGNDDWVMLRYRVAGTDGHWSCWTPRIPEDGSAPKVPGYYYYGSDVPGSNPFYRMPLAPDAFRYIQFEVSLYNDAANDGGAVPTLPKFDEFMIGYDEQPLPQSLRSGCPLDVFPNPARDIVNIRYEVAPEGGEVNARVFNTAGEVVDRESWYYLAGGLHSETINVSRWAPGVYIIVIDGLAKSGLAGLYCTQTGVRRKTLKERFVVRR
jgi:hypothetical protein